MRTPLDSSVTLEHERAALDRARRAAAARLAEFSRIGSGGGADALSDEYIAAVVAGAVEKFQRELVVFGRIDDDQPWRIGLYGIDDDGEQIVVDWRAPHAQHFYQSSFDEPGAMHRRVSYVGCIDDLFVEDFESGEVSGSSPLMTELSRSRGESMRTAVATLQADQDRLVRLDPDERLVVRGGPGTGKTVVGLHRAAWLVYHDRRLTAERILVIGPSDRFLRYVSAVLPTLGEAKITQTTFDRLLGPSAPSGDEQEWLRQLDDFETGLYGSGSIRVGAVRIRQQEVDELIDRLRQRTLSWRDRRATFASAIASRYELKAGDVSRAAADILPPCSAREALRRLTRCCCAPRCRDPGDGDGLPDVGRDRDLAQRARSPPRSRRRRARRHPSDGHRRRTSRRRRSCRHRAAVAVGQRRRDRCRRRVVAQGRRVRRRGGRDGGDVSARDLPRRIASGA